MPPAQWSRRIAILALTAAFVTVPPSRAAEDRPSDAQAPADGGLADSSASSKPGSRPSAPTSTSRASRWRTSGLLSNT